jgi:hypothetical protein
VQNALKVAWRTANCICAKRLIPFLPTLLDALECHDQLHLTEAIRNQLLSMSAATADRILRTQRHTRSQSLSTTKAGPLLKQHIPIRTFRDWDEVQPGFLEVDLVAHCGTHLEGNYLYTLTLTDVATGWTECLPLLHRGQEAVVAALQRARSLFPFPILGIDTDNGAEFINKEVVAFCEREQITFTRGRPYQKSDQCFVEQKNGVVVRQVVGRDRYKGEHAARQLKELYRALRLYVNCFQPSMKLVEKYAEGRKMRRVYDAAKTPLQRLLLSGGLPPDRQQELNTVAKALDPVRLFQQLERLQQAVFRCGASCSSPQQKTAATTLLRFELETCTNGSLPTEAMKQIEGSAPQSEGLESQENEHALDWRRTSQNPFAGQWEQILSWMREDPTRSCGDIFRALQSLFPERYQPLQIRTLQRGMRKIRTYLLQTREEARPTEVIHGPLPPAVKPPVEAPATDGADCLPNPFSPPYPPTPPSGQQADQLASMASTTSMKSMKSSKNHPRRKKTMARKLGKITHATAQYPTPSEEKPSQVSQDSHSSPTSPTPAAPEHDASPSGEDQSTTIEQAMESYLQDHRRAGHSPNTLEWHQTALRHFQQYLLAEHHLLQINQITETVVHGWLVNMQQTSMPTGKRFSAYTVATYARSVQAFCNWLVQRGYLVRTPFERVSFPRAHTLLPHLIQPTC